MAPKKAPGRTRLHGVPKYWYLLALLSISAIIFVFRLHGYQQAQVTDTEEKKQSSSVFAKSTAAAAPPPVPLVSKPMHAAEVPATATSALGIGSVQAPTSLDGTPAGALLRRKEAPSAGGTAVSDNGEAKAGDKDEVKPHEGGAKLDGEATTQVDGGGQPREERGVEAQPPSPPAGGAAKETAQDKAKDGGAVLEVEPAEAAPGGEGGGTAALGARDACKESGSPAEAPFPAWAGCPEIGALPKLSEPNCGCVYCETLSEWKGHKVDIRTRSTKQVLIAAPHAPSPSPGVCG